MWQMKGMGDNAHEQPVMNYTAEGLIRFLSAHETLGEERRLMGCRADRVVFLWTCTVSSKGASLNVHLTAPTLVLLSVSKLPPSQLTPVC